jgi:hypothetical protein
MLRFHSLVQRLGRAGRDDAPVTVWLLYDSGLVGARGSHAVVTAGSDNSVAQPQPESPLQQEVEGNSGIQPLVMQPGGGAYLSSLLTSILSPGPRGAKA